jgi:hypothetical protein
MNGEKPADVAGRVDQAEVGDEQNAELEEHDDHADEHRHDQRELDQRLAITCVCLSSQATSKTAEHLSGVSLVTAVDQAQVQWSRRTDPSVPWRRSTRAGVLI